MNIKQIGINIDHPKYVQYLNQYTTVLRNKFPHADLFGITRIGFLRREFKNNNISKVYHFNNHVHDIMKLLKEYNDGDFLFIKVSVAALYDLLLDEILEEVDKIVLDYCLFDGIDLSFPDFRIEYISEKGLKEISQLNRATLPDGSLNGFELKNSKAYVVSEKIQKFYYLDNFEQYFIYPRGINIEPSAACNLNCVMCPYRENDKLLFQSKYSNMPLELHNKIIDEISQYPVMPGIEYSYRGEPLLNKDMIKMVQYASKKGIYTALVTNAMLMNKETSRSLLDAGIGMVYASIDGADKETFTAIRRGGNYDKVVQNVIDFIDLKNIIRPEVMCGIKFVVQDKNKHQTEKFAREWINKADIIVQQFEYQSLDKSLTKYGQFKATAHEENINRLRQRRVCHALFLNAYIAVDGSVCPCTIPYHLNDELTYGNVKNDSLYNIFSGEKAMNWRKLACDSKYSEIPLCKLCDGTLCSEHVIERVFFADNVLLTKTSGYDLYENVDHKNYRNNFSNITKKAFSLMPFGNHAFNITRSLYKYVKRYI